MSEFDIPLRSRDELTDRSLSCCKPWLPGAPDRGGSSPVGILAACGPGCRRILPRPDRPPCGKFERLGFLRHATPRETEQFHAVFGFDPFGFWVITDVVVELFPVAGGDGPVEGPRNTPGTLVWQGKSCRLAKRNWQLLVELWSRDPPGNSCLWISWIWLSTSGGTTQHQPARSPVSCPV